MKYVKPSFNMTEFNMTETVAACDRVVTGTEISTVYNPQTVICGIGGQSETVFNSNVSGCSTKATSYAFGYYDFDKDGTAEYYFCWYADTGASSNRPTDAQKALMASVTGVEDPRSWHYCEVIGSTISTDILGFSY